MIKNINRFKVICNCIILLLFFVSCASKTNTTETAKSDNTEIVDISSELTTEEATTEDPDLFPIEVDYEPVEYDKYPITLICSYIDDCNRYWKDSLWSEWIVDEVSENGYVFYLREDKDIEEFREVYPFVYDYDEKTREIWLKIEADWLVMNERQFTYGMEDPVLVDFIVDYYNLNSDVKIDKSKITADSFDFFNYKFPKSYGYDWRYWRFSFDEITLYDIAEVDQKLARAILLSLGRKYFVQEIPYSFFVEKLELDEVTLHDYYEECCKCINDIYTNDEILKYYYNTKREYEGFKNGHKVGTIKDMSDDGYYYDFGFFEKIKSDDYFLLAPDFTQPIRNHKDVLLEAMLSKETAQIYTEGTFDANEDFWTSERKICPIEGGGFISQDIDIPGIEEKCRKELSKEFINYIDCCTYNNQLYTIAYFPFEPNKMYRDESNGAISMELSDDEQKIVIEAYEKAGTPLQTDGEGHIAVETPAHYKEVYGVDYRDVLKEAGLE